MLRKIFFLLIPLLIITIIFSIFVLFMSRKDGRGALQVTSIPKSQVFLDGKYIGNTPLSLIELPDLLDIGEYTLKLIPTEKGLKEWSEKINIYKGALTVVDRTFDKNIGSSTSTTITLIEASDKNKSELSVISFPSGAQVVLDGNNKGITPILLEDITISDHEIKILKDGYKEKVVKVKAVEGKKMELVVNLGIRTDLTSDSKTSSSSATIIKKVKISDTPTGFLRVRDSANLDSPQIGTVNPGDLLDLISEQEGWYQVTLLDGKTGWISADYAEKEDQEPIK